ncbi:TIGR02391 family protein [Thermosulfurimonas sp. F29]|uniref:TIGR02391 family protein n=1 Tax=Thermosulfurimonas sp. F29 TaxID=2867247 RepID=UPI001C83BE81|nr:TIGR02391 family protein [Thermosulfurimonas sp. F29]MBX6422934.1 TIGR02391 family protein [Thermosulfurimonas sp. F29]
MNYRLIAIQVGDLLKYDATINKIERAARSVFNFMREEFPNEVITSERAKLIHDWILSLARQKMNNDERNELLRKFLRLITPENLFHKVEEILREAGVNVYLDKSLEEFYSRNFHYLIHKHCFSLYKQRNYFHAVFEAAKVYNKVVKEKSKSSKDGYSLMMEVWDCKGSLKVTPCETETDKNVQEGLKFLSAGLMRAVRNPTAHEPAMDWPITKEDCLDLLSFLSFLLRQLDKAVYYKN